MRIRWPTLLLLMAIAWPAEAGELVRRLQPSGPDAASAGWSIANPGGQPLSRTVLTVDRPAIRRELYAIRGRVRCEGVVGRGFLEMWSWFPGGGHYFSRTLTNMGPMAALSGDQPWRPFVLPFQNEPGGPAPEKLVFNVVLPGAGKVELQSLELVQYAPGENPLAVATGAWLTGRQGGLVGGLLGGVLGLFGALIGLLGGRGRARRFVLGGMWAMGIVGAACLALGAVALLSAQPYAVFYPLLLVGLIALVLPLALYRRMRRRYQEIELRRMHALDAS